MIKSQTIPIQAAFQDNPIATVAVAIGPIRNPAIQSRSMVTNCLTPVSLPQLVLRGRTPHLESRNRVLDPLQT
mgnify:CR=1 FL=1